VDACRNCGATLVPSHTGPCYECGVYAVKTKRAEIRVEAGATVEVRAVVKKLFESLLDSAKKLRQDHQPEAAIVTAQTACEVCTEAVLTGALRERLGDGAMVDLITSRSWFNTFNPNTTRVKELYKELFGRSIQKESFWLDFTEHAKRRHKIVHCGKRATLRQADESIDVVEKVMQHLLKNCSD
jgi:uncharacterized Zn finger protein (UPF0148 family)